MSFRGGSRGGARGAPRGRGGFGGRGGGRGGGFGGFNQGPPDQVAEIATVSHVCEGEIIAFMDGNKVPLLARMIYTEKKQMIGKVDDVFGAMTGPGIAIKPDPNSGV